MRLIRGVMQRVVRGLVVAVLLCGSSARAADEKPSDGRSAVEDGSRTLLSMNEILAYVKGKARSAQEGRDPVKLNCVNEKSAQIASLIAVAQNALDDLRGLVQNGDSEAAAHVLEKINITQTKIQGYKTDADQCVGQIEAGDGTVVRDYKPGDVDKAADPTATVAPPPASFRPAPASPIQ
jgi:hypothetical protein